MQINSLEDGSNGYVSTELYSVKNIALVVLQGPHTLCNEN
jgi:hypothetical protein